jgi:cytochrome c553
MGELAKPLTDKDIENLAAFWSSLGSVVAVQE